MAGPKRRAAAQPKANRPPKPVPTSKKTGGRRIIRAGDGTGMTFGWIERTQGNRGSRGGKMK